MIKAIIEVTDRDWPYTSLPDIKKTFESREAALTWCRENSGTGFIYYLEKTIEYPTE